jgi:hypothetical protein
MEPYTVIDLYPPGGQIPMATCKVNGLPFISNESLVKFFTILQLNNAKHSEGKPEYDEMLEMLRTNFSNMKFNDPQ